MVTKFPNELKKDVLAVMLAAGASKDNAEVVAEHLVSSNLCGVDTHGLFQIPMYLQDIKKDRLLPKAKPQFLKEDSSSALISGNWTFGQVAARFAMEVAILKAVRAGIAVVSLVQTHHIGRLGHYVEMAAAKEMISMVMGSGYFKDTPRTAPYGGRKGALDTNPVAMGTPAPSDESGPVMFDYATTAVSGARVIIAERSGKPLPVGCILDKHGNPTTHAKDYTDGGTFVPFGGHKGYALMVAAEYLGQIFSGSYSFAESGRGGPIFSHQGVTMIVFRADLFQPIQQFKDQAEQTAARIRTTPPAPGFDEVLVPGDPEMRTRLQRQREGIPIPEEIWKPFVDAALSVGVTID